MYAAKVRTALKDSVDTRKLAEAWAALHPKAFKSLGPEYAHFLGRARHPIERALRPVLKDAATEGWVLGQQSAIASARSVPVAKATATADVPAVNWADWQPGDVEAAYQVAGSGLRDLLASQEVTIKSIASSRLEELGDVLAAHLSSPETERPLLPEEVPPMYSVDSLADSLEGVLDNPERAVMVAQTEIARASQAAAQWVFQSLGVGEVRVSTAADARVCAVCRSAESAGPQPIGTYTVPLHPRCRCATVAAMPPLQPLPKLPGVPDSAMPELDDLGEDAEAEEPASLDFSSAYEAHQWIKANSPKLGRQEARAVRDYTEYSFGVNSGLRAGSELSPASAKMAQGLDSAMRPLPVPLLLRRVVNLNAFPGGLPAEGAVIADQAYASTSVGPDIGGAEVRLVITAPEGTPAVVAGRYSTLPDQREVILARGTALRVDQVRDPGGGGVVEISATVVPGGAAAAAKQLAKAAARERPETLAERMADAVYQVIA